MTRAMVYPATAAVLYVYAATFAQAADGPRFEGADVHSSAPSTNIRNNFMQGPFVNPAPASKFVRQPYWT